MGATARPAGRLESIRRVDWRFLLPEAAFGTVLVVEPADGAVVDGLELVARGVTTTAAGGEHARPDLVVTIAPDDRALRTAIGRVPDGGWLYVGSGTRRTGRRTSLRRVARVAKDGGLVDIRRSWHWPSEPSALEIAPLDDGRAIRLALDRRQSGRAARLKAALATMAVRVGMLDAIVPGWSVVARRPRGDERGAGHDPTPIDPVRGNLPDGSAAGVVLLTPRFRASRHVIGLALRSDGEGLAAVVKLPRLADDDGGIRREGAALAHASASGVRGVPEVIALVGAPRPVLVETALDGVVIGSREVRARPSEMLDEVEAWTRTLAGPPDRRRVPFRTLYAPALERIATAVGADGVAADAITSAVGHERSPAAIGRLMTRTAAILDALRDVELPVVLEHGDLAPPNLLRLRDGGLGAVDWEVADVDGLPLGDLLFYAAFSEGSLAAGADDPAPRGALTLAEPSIVRQAAVLGIEPTLVPALALAMWARWADRQLARFADPTTPLGERLPARHLRSWEAAIARLDSVR